MERSNGIMTRSKTRRIEMQVTMAKKEAISAEINTNSNTSVCKQTRSKARVKQPTNLIRSVKVVLNRLTQNDLMNAGVYLIQDTNTTDHVVKKDACSIQKPTKTSIFPSDVLDYGMSTIAKRTSTPENKLSDANELMNNGL